MLPRRFQSSLCAIRQFPCSDFFTHARFKLPWSVMDHCDRARDVRFFPHGCIVAERAVMASGGKAQEAGGGRALLHPAAVAPLEVKEIAPLQQDGLEAAGPPPGPGTDAQHGPQQPHPPSPAELQELPSREPARGPAPAEVAGHSPAGADPLQAAASRRPQPSGGPGLHGPEPAHQQAASHQYPPSAQQQSGSFGALLAGSGPAPLRNGGSSNDGPPAPVHPVSGEMSHPDARGRAEVPGYHHASADAATVSGTAAGESLGTESVPQHLQHCEAAAGPPATPGPQDPSGPTAVAAAAAAAVAATIMPAAEARAAAGTDNLIALHRPCLLAPRSCADVC